MISLHSSTATAASASIATTQPHSSSARWFVAVAASLVALLMATMALTGALGTRTGTSTVATTETPETVRLVVSLSADGRTTDLDRTLEATGAARRPTIEPIRTVSVNVPADRAGELLTSLSANAAVTHVAPAVQVRVAALPDDAEVADQWALDQIGWTEAYGTTAISGSATIAVLDTGIDAAHPDLTGRIVGSASFVGGDATTDPHGHGTALAGIAAATTNNATGIAGVAFSNVSLLSAQVLGADGTGEDVDVIAGLLWAVDEGADVVLIGFSADDYSPALAEAIAYAWSQGTIVVAATGNDGSEAVTYPSGMPHVLGVAGTDRNDAVTASSNTGSALIAAPGVGIRTTAVGGGYTTTSGTSAAVAHVAGAAALLAAQGHDNAYIFDQLRWSAAPIEGATFGRLDLAAALGAPRTGDAVTPFETPEASPNPPTYEAAGTITNLTATGASLVNDAETTWTFAFTPQSNIALADWVRIKFPADFDLSNINASSFWPGSSPQVTFNSGFTASAIAYNVGVSGQQVTITFWATGDPEVAAAGASVSISLSNVINGAPGYTVNDFGFRTAKDFTGQPEGFFVPDTIIDGSAGPDVTPPVLQTAAVNGTSLVLTYNEALDGGSVPATGAFSIGNSGAGQTVTNVAVAGTQVTLTLAPGVANGDTVTVSYTAGANPTQDVAGNDAVNLTNQAVTNNTPGDVTPPVIQTVAVNSTSMVLTYNEALDGGSVPATGAFTVSGGHAVTGVAVNGTQVTLTLSPGVAHGEVVTVSYNSANAGGNPTQDAAGNDAANLTNQAVTNNTPDTTPPVIQTAAVNGTSMVLTYNEALDGGSVPATGAFTVSGGHAVTGVAVNGTQVTLTLNPGVTSGEVVTVSYNSANAGGNPTQDAAGNDAANLTNQAVTNNTPDVTPPVLQTAAVNGASLVLTYNEALDAGSVPATGAFTVSGGHAVTGVAVNGTQVTLTLNPAVGSGDVITVSYNSANAGGNPTQDAAGNDAANLTNQAVTNNTADVTPPVLQTAAVNGTSMILTYNEALDAGSVPATGAFTVSGGHAVTGVAVNGTQVTLTLNPGVTSGEVVTVSYNSANAGGNPTQDQAGNDAANLTNQAVTNNTPDVTPPVLQTATVNGASLVLTYNEALDAGSVPATGAFTVSGGHAVTGVAVNGTQVTLTLNPAVGPGDVITVSYNSANAGGNPTQDAAGNDAANLTNQAVTNNTADVTPPVLQTAAVNGTSMILTYNEALDAGSVPATGAFTVSGGHAVTGVAVNGTQVTLTLNPGVTSGEVMTVSYNSANAGGNPTQDQAGNDAANLTNQAVTNNTPDVTPPVLQTATVSGTSLVLTYNEALDGGSVPNVGDFVVNNSGAPQVVTGVSVNGTQVTLTLSPGVATGNTVTLDYTAGANPIRDTSANNAGNLVGQAITNNTPAPPPPGGGGGGAPPAPTTPMIQDGLPTGIPGLAPVSQTLPSGGSTPTVVSALVVNTTTQGPEELQTRVSLSVPPAAVPGGQRLVVQSVTTIADLMAVAPLPNEDGRIVSAVSAQVIDFNNRPISVSFDRPITITATLPVSAVPANSRPANFVMVFWDNELLEWIEVPSRSRELPDGSMEVETDAQHFTLYAVKYRALRGFVAPAVFDQRGVGFVVFEAQGSFEELSIATLGERSMGVWAQSSFGRFHLLVVDGPAFLETAFRAAFPDGFPRMTPMLVVRDSGRNVATPGQ